MRRNAAFLIVVLGCASATFGCNSAAPPPPAAQPAVHSAPLPGGSDCNSVIARYRAIQDNDLSMGHVNQSVYAQIQKEIAEAQSACSAGEEGKALSLVRASKARHGYPG